MVIYSEGRGEKQLRQRTHEYEALSGGIPRILCKVKWEGVSWIGGDLQRTVDGHSAKAVPVPCSIQTLLFLLSIPRFHPSPHSPPHPSFWSHLEFMEYFQTKFFL